MPPPSSPVPRLSSVPSDVFTVQPSPDAHHFSRLCQRSGRGTGGHLVRFWAMLSTPHRHTSPPIDQQQGSASTVCHPSRLVLVLFLQVVRKGIAKEQAEGKEEKENQGEGCRRHLRQFLASLLFLLMPTPSTPSPAARHFARLCHRSGRGTGGHLVRFWAMSSPHLATTSPANSSHRASPRRSAILPASSSSSSFRW